MSERESGSTGERARFAGWFGYVTLVAACILAFRVLMVRLTYRYFWINGWKVAIAMIVGALGLIFVLANMRIS